MYRGCTVEVCIGGVQLGYVSGVYSIQILSKKLRQNVSAIPKFKIVPGLGIWGVSSVTECPASLSIQRH